MMHHINILVIQVMFNRDWGIVQPKKLNSMRYY